MSYPYLLLSVYAKNSGPSENRDLFDCHEGWKEHFWSSFSFFYQTVDTISTMSWSKQMMQSHCMFLMKQMQCRASEVDKIKIEPAVISLMEDTTSSIMILSPKKTVNLCVFSKSSKWMTRWSESRELMKKFKNFLFWYSQTKLIQWTTFLVVLVVLRNF